MKNVSLANSQPEPSDEFDPGSKQLQFHQNLAPR